MIVSRPLDAADDGVGAAGATGAGAGAGAVAGVAAGAGAEAAAWLAGEEGPTLSR